MIHSNSTANSVVGDFSATDFAIVLCSATVKEKKIIFINLGYEEDEALALVGLRGALGKVNRGLISFDYFRTYSRLKDCLIKEEKADRISFELGDIYPHLLEEKLYHSSSLHSILRSLKLKYLWLLLIHLLLLLLLNDILWKAQIDHFLNDEGYYTFNPLTLGGKQQLLRYFHLYCY